MLLSKFSFQFMKKLFLAYFWSISEFSWQNKFFEKIWLCHTLRHKGFQRHAKIQTNLNIQFQENQTNDRMEGETDPIS